MIPTSWNEIKSQVQKLNPEFYEAIEEVRPDPNLKLWILEYGYGDTITDENYFYLPDNRALLKPVPQMFLLEGVIESYFETTFSSVPWNIFKPGKVFPTLVYAESSVNTLFSPNNRFKLTAGIRSAYMLQLHGFNEYYANFQKHYKIPKEFKPTNPFDHYKILSDIAKKEHASWKVRILLFDNKWLKYMWENPKWSSVRSYFYKQAFTLTNPWHWSVTFNHSLREIGRTHNFRLKDYSEDCIRQILFNAAAIFPAFIPAYNQRALPLHTLASAFNEFYGDHNLPVIMHAWLADQTNETLYLSVSQNTATTYDIKSFRPLLYLQEVKEYLPQYLEHLQTHTLTRDTIYSQMHNKVDVQYFSEKGIPAEGILRASDLQNDPRILEVCKAYQVHSDQTFPERTPFLKAFVGFKFKP